MTPLAVGAAVEGASRPRNGGPSRPSSGDALQLEDAARACRAAVQLVQGHTAAGTDLPQAATSRWSSLTYLLNTPTLWVTRRTVPAPSSAAASRDGSAHTAARPARRHIASAISPFSSFSVFSVPGGRPGPPQRAAAPRHAPGPPRRYEKSAARRRFPAEKRQEDGKPARAAAAGCTRPFGNRPRSPFRPEAHSPALKTAVGEGNVKQTKLWQKQKHLDLAARADDPRPRSSACAAFR